MYSVVSTMIHFQRVDMYFDVTEDDGETMTVMTTTIFLRSYCHLYLVTVSEIIDALESNVTETPGRRKERRTRSAKSISETNPGE